MLPPPKTTRVHFRRYATKSPHALWYSTTVPAMIPVFLLGSAVYLGLELTQLKLAHEKYMEESASRIKELEAEVAALRQKHFAQETHAEQSSSSPKKRSWW